MFYKTWSGNPVGYCCWKQGLVGVLRIITIEAVFPFETWSVIIMMLRTL
jgi:hypothetical protein